MKKCLFYAVMLLVVVSCTRNEEISAVHAPSMYGYTEDDSASRTVIETDSEGVGTIFWNPGDEISVFFGTNNVRYHSDNTERAKIVSFSSDETVTVSRGKKWAVYPYSSDNTCDGSSVTIPLPSLQEGVADTFDTNLFPMVAVTDTNELYFRNVCGGVKFSLSRDDIRKITFRGNDNENLVGKVRISLNGNGCPVSEVKEGINEITLTPKGGNVFAKNTNYYLAMLPEVLTDGFTVTFETVSQTGTFKYAEKPVEIKRSIFSVKENIDTYAAFVNKPEFEKPFTVTATGDISVAIAKEGTPAEVSLEYRKGDDRWASYTVGTQISLSKDEYVQFRATDVNEDFSADLGFYYVTANGGNLSAQIIASGNIMSLVDRSMTSTQVNVAMFRDLFWSCRNLVSAAELKLPANQLARQCYYDMFVGCTGLNAAPDLPATTLADSCYRDMFRDCTSLTTAPELPATTLAIDCYWGMFKGCTWLNAAPVLPATQLADGCYDNMFNSCKSLTTAPDLPATQVYLNSYYGMFSYCTNLTTAPALPATELDVQCYDNMFYGCTGLTTAPVLPATELADYCYKRMFYGCKNLTSAPDLPATTLADSCYSSMFSGCSKLSCLKVNFTEWVEGATTQWLDGVSSSGTFECPAALETKKGSGYIPDSWVVNKLYPFTLDLAVKSVTEYIGSPFPQYPDTRYLVTIIENPSEEVETVYYGLWPTSVIAKYLVSDETMKALLAQYGSEADPDVVKGLNGVDGYGPWEWMYGGQPNTSYTLVVHAVSVSGAEFVGYAQHTTDPEEEQHETEAFRAWYGTYNVNIGGTDYTATVSEKVAGQSMYLDLNAYVEGFVAVMEYDAANDTCLISQQAVGQWTHPQYGTVTDTIFGFISYNGGYPPLTDNGYTICTVHKDGDNLSIPEGETISITGFGDMQFAGFTLFGATSAGNLLYTSDEEFPFFPLTFTKQADTKLTHVKAIAPKRVVNKKNPNRINMLKGFSSALKMM